MDGQVIGINTAIFSPSGGSIGIGFSIPSNMAKKVVADLKAYGHPRRGWLGVKIQQVTPDIAESLGLSKARGALVAGVADKGPAKPAGIKSGDVIVKFDGKDVKDPRDLSKMVASTPVGKDVAVTVVRGGKEQDIKVTLGRLEDGEKQASAGAGKDGDSAAPGRTTVQKALGMELGAVTADARKKFSLKDNAEGVLITNVDQDSTAAEKQIKAGDRILEINQETVAKPEGVTRKLKELKDQGRKSALLFVANPQDDKRFVPLQLQ
jgi:serine protease Do